MSRYGNKGVTQVREDFGCTPKQKKFCEEYVKDYNKVQAELRCNPNKSYGAASSYASILLQKPKIRDYIAYLEKNVGRELGVSKLGMAQELKNLAFSNIGDIYKDWTKLRDINELTREQKAAIAEVDAKIVTMMTKLGEQKTEFVRIRMHDKLKAMEQLARLMGMNEPDALDVRTASISLTLTDKDLYDKMSSGQI